MRARLWRRLAGLTVAGLAGRPARRPQSANQAQLELCRLPGRRAGPDPRGQHHRAGRRQARRRRLFHLGGHRDHSAIWRCSIPSPRSLQANGALKGGTASPSNYQSTMRIWSRQESIVLTYAPNGTVGIEAVPLTRQAQMAQQQGYANGTMDPASLIVAVASLFAQTGSCAGQYQLFDGARRYDLALAQGGYADLDRHAELLLRGLGDRMHRDARNWSPASSRARSTPTSIRSRPSCGWRPPSPASRPCRCASWRAARSAT